MSLPQLRKCKQIAQTPDEHSKRGDECTHLRNQVIQLQKQLEQVQGSKSFVMKIQNQQCTLCQRFKFQIEQLIKQDKLVRKQYELRIEELMRQQVKKNTQNANIQTDQLLKGEKDCQTLDIQVPKQNTQIQNNQNLAEYEQIIIDFHKEVQTKSFQLLQYKELYEGLKIQHDQLKLQHNGCSDKIHNLYLEINVLKENSNSYKLPDNIVNLKKSIDHTLQLNMIKQLSCKTQDTELPMKATLIIQQIETDLFVSLRCFKCKEFYTRPCTYVPCGHSVCHGCQGQKCEKCLKPITSTFRNNHLDQLLRIYNQVREVKETCLKR